MPNPEGQVKVIGRDLCIQRLIMTMTCRLVQWARVNRNCRYGGSFIAATELVQWAIYDCSVRTVFSLSGLMPVVDCEGKLTTLPTKLLTLFKLCECIRAGVFPKLPSNPATLLKACTRNTVLAWRVGGFLPSHGYSKHESKFFFWRFARPIVRCTVLTVVSTFPFFFYRHFGTHTCARCNNYRRSPPESTARTAAEGALSFVGVRWGLSALHCALSTFSVSTLYVEGLLRSGNVWKLCCIA